MQSIAFHLPQFHPIRENDEWWGKGFTEWTNVVKSRPRFAWHEQPHLPADLGFYDLRLPESRQAQAELAREYGVGAFCYYHYWFNGRRIIERPVNEILASGEPDFPFCLCWANENWTRIWDGGDREVLLGQDYGEQDDLNHIRYLSEVFADARYVRIDGKPLFLVYRASLIPNPARTVEVWRNEAQRLGVGELFLCNVECQSTEHGRSEGWGFDGAVEFQPDWSNLGTPIGRNVWMDRARRLPGVDSAYYYSRVFDYAQMVDSMLAKPEVDYLRFPCVTPMWDNSSRRKYDPTILRGSTPELYEKWLTRVVKKVATRPADRQIVFINAWNEWAEGNHLEPCQRWGRAYLEATRRALSSASAELPEQASALMAAR